jgi:hypothetical protein
MTRVIKRDGTVGPPATRQPQCPPHLFNYIHRINGAQAGPTRCSNCGKPKPTT